MKEKFLLLTCFLGTLYSAQQGKVGINTNTPSAALDIVTKTSTGTNKALRISNSSSQELITVKDNGQVGINQAAPESDALLELKSSNKSLLLTRVSSVSDIASPISGMLVYEIGNTCVKAYENNAWSSCLSAGGGSSSSANYPPSGIVNCNNDAFINPKSVGLNFSRGFVNNSYIEDRPILMNALGTKFYANTNNLIYDLNVLNLYATNGYTNINSGDIGTRFPINSDINNYGTWKEIKAIGQLYPTKSWKQFSNFQFIDNYWLLLLSTDGELKTVRYQGRNANANSYPGVSGPEGIGKNTLAVTVTMNPQNFYVTTDIKAYSAVGTAVTTNWAWFEPYSYPYLSYANMVTGAIAYNQADGLYYTWGSVGYNATTQQIPTMSKVLLRNNPSTIDQAMTPLPATILNGLLTTLSTKIKTPSEQHNTILVQKGGPSPASNTHPYLDFITESNKVVRYILDTGAYSVLSLPAGVNPVSLVTFYCQYTPSYGYTLDGLYILGDDGKIYLTFTYPTAAGQSGTVSTYANSVWGTTNFPFVTQITFTTDNNLAFLANGKIGALLPQSSAVPVYAYPLPYQSGTTKQILFTQYVNSAMTGYNNSLSFTKSQDDLFRIYDAQPSHATTKNAYNITPLGNYFNDTSYTYSGGTSDKFLIYTEFHPSKCVSY